MSYRAEQEKERWQRKYGELWDKFVEEVGFLTWLWDNYPDDMIQRQHEYDKYKEKLKDE